MFTIEIYGDANWAWTRPHTLLQAEITTAMYEWSVEGVKKEAPRAS